MVLLSHFYLLFMDVSSLHAQPYTASSLFLPHSPPSSYIFLGCCTMSTAWSVCKILIYLNLTTSSVVVNFDLSIQPWNLRDLSKLLCYFWVHTPCLTIVNSLSSGQLPGVIVEVPQFPLSLKKPFRNLCPWKPLWVYACPYLGQS